jgi:cobalt/nickel transport protein
MRANTKLFLVAGLLLALALALFVSPFADRDPDGLSKVAQDQGFASAEREHELSGSPVAGYQVDGVHDDKVSKAVAGLVGVLATFGLGVGAFALLRTLRRSPEPDGDVAAEARAG